MTTQNEIPYGIQFWHQRHSRNGIPGDALNSMLQKSIRRGLEENALGAAWEMYLTSSDYLDKLWLRLNCIAVEDIGFGDDAAVSLIRALDGMRRAFSPTDPSQEPFFVHAVRYLCRCTKERTSDHIRGMLKRAFQNGYVPSLPEDGAQAAPSVCREEAAPCRESAQKAEALPAALVAFCSDHEIPEPEAADRPWGPCAQSGDLLKRTESLHGLPADRLLARLSDAMRGGDTKSALAAAWELYLSGPYLLDEAWRSLLVFSVTDVSLTDPRTTETVWNLNQMRKNLTYDDSDQPIHIVHAVRCLCRGEKDPSTGAVTSLLSRCFAGGYVPTVPDYVYDMHTVQGRSLGRDEAHFLGDASRVSPQLDREWVRRIHDDYVDLCSLCKTDPGSPVVEAFLSCRID